MQAKAASSLNIEHYKQRAIKATKFLKSHSWDPNTGELLWTCYLNEKGDITNM